MDRSHVFFMPLMVAALLLCCCVQNPGGENKVSTTESAPATDAQTLVEPTKELTTTLQSDQSDATTTSTTDSMAPTTTIEDVISFSEGKIEHVGSIDRVSSVGGRLAYAADKRFIYIDGAQAYDSWTHCKMGRDGLLVNSCEISEGPVDVNGKLAFTLKRVLRLDNEYVTDGSEPESIVIYDGKELQWNHGYDYVMSHNPVDAGGKLAYETQEQKGIMGMFSSIVYDGKVIENANSPVYVGGRLAYLSCHWEGDASSISEVCFVVYDGKEYGREYDEVQMVSDVGGKIAYLGIRRFSDGSVKSYLAYDGREYYEEDGEGYLGDIPLDDDRPMALGGKLLYKAGYFTNGSTSEKTFFVLDGKKAGLEYAYVQSPLEVGGKLAYVAGGNDSGEFLVYEGKKVSEKYDRIIPDPVLINGKIVFIGAKKDEKGKETFYIVRQK